MLYFLYNLTRRRHPARKSRPGQNIYFLVAFVRQDKKEPKKQIATMFQQGTTSSKGSKGAIKRLKNQIYRRGFTKSSNIMTVIAAKIAPIRQSSHSVITNVIQATIKKQARQERTNIKASMVIPLFFLLSLGVFILYHIYIECQQYFKSYFFNKVMPALANFLTN